MTDATDAMDRRLNPFRYRADGSLTEGARRQDALLDSAAAGGPAGWNDAADGLRRPGAAPSLRVSPALLRERAGRADAVAEEFGRVCHAPLRETGRVAGGLRGFRCAGAFAAFEARWEAGVRHARDGLIGGFARDLRDGADRYAATDRDAAGDFAP